MNIINENQLASELADALKDKESLQSYILLCQKYSEPFLRKILNKVVNIPEDKIRKSRGALFTFLVKQNEKNITDNSLN